MSEICLQMMQFKWRVSEGTGRGGGLVLTAVEFRCWVGMCEFLNFRMFDKFHYKKFGK